MIASFFLAVLFILTSCDNRSDTTGSELRHMLNESVTVNHPGFVLHVDSPGRGTWDFAAGYANVENAERMSTEHRLSIGSCTKVFTVSACMLLREEGMFDLDRSLRDILPELNVPQDSLITMRMLLSMNSGIPDYANDTDWVINALLENPERQFTPEELVQQALSIVGPDGIEPGGDFHYSNTNYIILGLALERLTGKTYDQVITDRILIPLGLHETTVVEEPVAFATGYVDFDEDEGPDPYPAWNPTYTWAAGCIASTSSDLGRFVQSLYNGELVSQESLEMMMDWQVVIENEFSYGLGFAELPGNDLVGHNGAVIAFASEMWIHQPSGTVITVLTNSNKVEYAHAFLVVTEAMEILGLDSRGTIPLFRDPGFGRSLSWR